jgi:hypothetical protein
MVLTSEDRMGFHLDDNVEISRRAAGDGGFPFTA